LDQLWLCQSVVPLHLHKEGGLDPFQVGSQTNPAEFANKNRKKSGTLTDFVPARTIRAATANRPGIRVGRSACFGAQHMPLPFGGDGRTKSTYTTSTLRETTDLTCHFATDSFNQ
jgi:hypothetical protein